MKNVLVVSGAIAALLAFRMFHVSKGPEKPDGAIGGFVALTRPTDAPAGKILIIGPENCPKEEGRRMDSLERAVHAAGIPCVRLQRVSLAPADSGEARRLNKVMNGELPIVFVGEYAKNNPSLEEIKTQLRRNTQQ
jgi:hypothetical protein